jgi:enterochelin esterase-like enzyme
MGMTSGPFLVVMCGLAIGGIAGTVWMWPLVTRTSVRHIAARLAMIAVSELLVIAAFLVCLNVYFSFYTSWSQLFGSGATPLAGTAKTDMSNGPVLTVTRAEPAPPPGAPVKSLPSPSAVAAGPHGIDLIGLKRDPSSQQKLAQTGELLGISINGPHTGIAVSGDYVYLPPQYFQPAYAHAKFPAVLALTGYPGSAWSIVKRLKLPAAVALASDASKVRPAVYVMMNVSVAMPRDTECTNVPAGPQVETFFAEDVPAAIERAFRVASGPGNWAALGYSTGGYCAVKMAMMDPSQFSLAVSLAGYYVALEDQTTGDLYGGSGGYKDENNLDWRLTHLPAPPISVLVTSSVIGEKTYPGTVQFLSLVRPPMRGYSLYLPQGGHNFKTWGRELPQALEWLSLRLRPALPQASRPADAAPHRSPAARPRGKA